LIPLLLIFVPLIAGIISFFISGDRIARSWTLFVSIITLGVSVAGLTIMNSTNDLQYSAPWMQSLGSSFSVKLDGMGQILCLLNAIAYPLVILGTWTNTYQRPGHFFGLMLLAQAGMMGVFLAMDALLFYFFWELALIPMYFLCSQWGGEKRIRVTFKFFIYTFIGSILMLVGILYLQARTPDQSFSISSFYNLQLPVSEQAWIFWLFFIAFAVKMPVFPFHTWQPDTYEQAPTTVTMILSGVMVKMGLLGLIRWLLPVLPLGVYQWSDFIPPLALTGLIYASFIAIRQDDIKRLVAYSSIAHIGLMCAAAFSHNEYGLQGVMIQMFSHGINIIGLWIMVEVIEKRFGTRKLSELGGLAQQAPALAIFFVIIALANIALPLTNAFVGEFLMFNGLMNFFETKYNVVFTVMAGIGIILSAVYTLNMIRKIFYGQERKPVTGMDLRWMEKIALAVIVALILWFGIYPQPLLDLTVPVTQELLNTVRETGTTGQQ
jgi:NADH-quinone oxidoreductase subunit M